MKHTKTDRTVEKVLHYCKVKPSDFKFEWRIYRDKKQDVDAMLDELDKLGLLDKIDSNKVSIDDQRRIEEVKAKHTRPWFRYKLYRRCKQQDALVKALSQMTKELYKKVLAECPGIQVYRDVDAVEHKKARTFSSLAAMQHYADSHKLNIDVYELWNKTKTTLATQKTK